MCEEEESYNAWNTPFSWVYKDPEAGKPVVTETGD